MSGYDEGTFLDGTYKREQKKYSHGTTTGRIKFGTEIQRRVQEHHDLQLRVRLLARAGAGDWSTAGDLEDVTITNLTMRDIANAPIYLRLGGRIRGAGRDAGRQVPARERSAT